MNYLLNTLSAWFRNRLIRVKIIIVYIPLILIPLLLLGYVSNNFYNESIIRHTSVNVESNSQLIITRIEGMLSNAENSANMLTLNLNKVFDSNVSSFRLHTEITNQLSYALLVFPEVDSAVFIDNEGNIYGSSWTLEDKEIPQSFQATIDELSHSNGSNVWFAMQRRAFLTMNADEPVISLGKRINDISTGNMLGILIVNIAERSFSDLYKALGSYSDVGRYTIIDNSEMIISSGEADQLLQPWQGGLQQSNQLLISKTPFTLMDWQLVSEVPIRELTEDSRAVTKVILLIGAICLIIAIAAAAYLSKIIAIPIIALSKGMRKVRAGNLDYQLTIQNNDETGLLASGFNEMLAQIRELLSAVQYEQKKKREYELALIQAQIKPHFLYNTLDVIYALAEMGRNRDVQKTTKALADFYRVVLSRGREVITLEEEMNNVRDYLRIQRIRYSDVFDFSIDLAPEILHRSILKLTIQPLVENAIYHGLKENEGFGHLYIKASLEEGQTRIVVGDNGAGIPDEKLTELRNNLANAQRPPNSYGLWNVNDRIRLYFGEQYGLRLQSKLGIGTEVTIILPNLEEGGLTGADHDNRR